MNILTLCFLSVLNISNNQSNDTTRLPIGFWVSENFDVISIDSTNNVLDIIFYHLDNNGYQVTASQFHDTLSFYSEYFTGINDTFLTNVKFEFLILNHSSDSLLLKPISKYAIEFMDTEQEIIFTQYGSGVNI